MSQNNYHIQYRIDGEQFNYKTSSKFLAEKMVNNVISFADVNRVPLWKTKLKLVVYKQHYEQWFLTVGKLDVRILIANFHYN